MAWEKIKVDDKPGSNRPFVSISKAYIAFNVVFTQMAALGPDKRVTIYADAKALKLGFAFHSEEKPDSLPLSLASSDRKGGARRGVFCTARGVAKKYPWVESVTKLPIKDRRFEPTKEEDLWVIQLCPAFEQRRARESTHITSELRGIYRYVQENGTIVYIGRGEIKERLMAPEREKWDFDVVEYSIIENPDQQVKWEEYWLTRFREDHEGKLPFYNRISGETPEETIHFSRISSDPKFRS